MTTLSKRGFNMNPATRNRIVEIMTSPEHDGMTQGEIAAEIGVSPRTLRDYLTAETWAEIRQARLEVMYRSLALVDRAIFHKASQGDIHAAKLIYARWDEVKGTLPAVYNLHNLKDLDAAIDSLQQRIDQLEQHPAYPETTEAAPVAAETATAGAEPPLPLPAQQ